MKQLYGYRLLDAEGLAAAQLGGVLRKRAGRPGSRRNPIVMQPAMMILGGEFLKEGKPGHGSMMLLPAAARCCR